jgi:hypothetical protein
MAYSDQRPDGPLARSLPLSGVMQIDVHTRGIDLAHLGERVMNAPMSFISAVGVLVVILVGTVGLARFLLWRDGLRDDFRLRHSRDQGRAAEGFVDEGVRGHSARLA